jgi:hypothetical protein
MCERTLEVIPPSLQRRILGCLLPCLMWVPVLSFADCYETNPAAQQRCLAQEQAARQAQQEQQRQQQQEAMRQQQEAQQRQQQQEAMRQQQQEAQQRQAQQEAYRQQQQQQEAQRQAQQQQAYRQQQQQQQEAQRQAQQQQAYRQQQQQETQRQAQQQQANRQQQQRTEPPLSGRTPQEIPQGVARPDVRSGTAPAGQPGLHGGATGPVAGDGARQSPAENPFVHKEQPAAPQNPFVHNPASEAPKTNPFVHSSDAPEAVHAGADSNQHKEIVIDEKSRVQSRTDKSGYVATRTMSPDSRVVVEERKLSGNTSQVTAYKEVKSGDTVSRLYTDGRVVTKGSNFHSTGIIGGLRFVKYDNGLRSAYRANGKPLYTEKFREIRRPSGETVQVIQRTTMVPVSGRTKRIPVVRYYTATSVNNVTYVVYQPLSFARVYYLELYQPFVDRLTLAVLCPQLCPPGTANFQSPPDGYTDPMDLVGDLAMSDATSDEVSPDVPAPEELALDVGNPDGADVDLEANLPPPPPEMVAAEQAFQGSAEEQTAELRVAAGELRRSVRQQPGLVDSVTDTQFTHASFMQPAGGAGDPAPALAPIQIPDYARAQLRKEARLTVALQQNGHQLRLPDVAWSDYGKVFVFQAAAPIDVMESGSDLQCTLSGGDLVRFARIPAKTDSVVTMTVMASRAGHCRAGDKIELGLTDLQDMMNAFSERVEREKMRIAACEAPGGACVRT